MPEIHPTALVADGANIAASAKIGPYCVVGADVTLGEGTELISHVNIDGWTVMGDGCTVYPFASIGTRTQDLKYKGGRPGVAIGDCTVLREYVTVNAATFDGDITRVGRHCLLMAYAHIAHDCLVGDHVIMANCGTLAGHVIVEDHVILGGLSAVHQFVTLGSMSITGGCSKVVQDVPPYMTADGNPLAVRGLNSEGLKRRDVAIEVRSTLKKAYRIIYREQYSKTRMIEELKQLDASPEMEHLISFIEQSQRGITR